MTDKLATRKLLKKIHMSQNLFSSYDGTTVETETSSNFPHVRTALASYRGSPFVTGDNNNRNNDGLKTEIFDRQTSTWVEADDYPYTSTKYVS